MQEIIEVIIEKNIELFTKEEYAVIKNNIELTRKIYLLGFINSREI